MWRHNAQSASHGRLAHAARTFFVSLRHAIFLFNPTINHTQPGHCGSRLLNTGPRRTLYCDDVHSKDQDKLCLDSSQENLTGHRLYELL